MAKSHPPRILQVFRAPLGGLFRHVCDVTQGLVTRGYEVGMVCSDEDAGALSNSQLARIERLTALGLHRITMPRLGGFTDISATRRIISLARDYDIDLIHGHGAKGGTYARLAASLTGKASVYTPHGGSLHYSPKSPSGMIFLTFERLLNRMAGNPDRHAILFESDYSARTYEEKIGKPRATSRTIHNGLGPDEFSSLNTSKSAADLLFIGEMRELKGVAVLLEALKSLNGTRPVTANFVGSGPDKDRFEALSNEYGLTKEVTFHDPMPARDAFPLGRVTVVPSLAESFPYIVLEAIAAARPLITTKVGGIPEIFGPLSQRLVPPGDAAALAHAIQTRLASPAESMQEAKDLRAHVKAHFNTEKMVAGIAGTYADLLAEKKPFKVTQEVSDPTA